MATGVPPISSEFQEERGRKDKGQKGYMHPYPFKVLTWKSSVTLCLSLVDQNLVTWLYQAARKAWKCSFLAWCVAQGFVTTEEGKD